MKGRTRTATRTRSSLDADILPSGRLMFGDKGQHYIYNQVGQLTIRICQLAIAIV